MASLGACGLFAAISGSNSATTATIGSMLHPEMVKGGYDERFSAATAAAGGTVGIIIPPSIPMILYATSANVSVEQLFVAGIVPGLMGAFGLMLVAHIFARRYNLPTEEAFNTKRLRETFVEALPAFALPIIILGGIYGARPIFRYIHAARLREMYKIGRAHV